VSALLELKAGRIALGPARRLGPLDLSLAPGTVTALLGRNGVGKTSLLRALARIEPLDEGTLRIEGVADDERDRRALARRLAYLPQAEPSIDTELTVGELLELGRAPYVGWLGRLGDPDRRAIEAAAKATSVEGLLHRRLDGLSAGERQRAHLGRCFAQDTALLILDEPTASMDPVHAIDLLGKVQARIHGAPRAALIVVHDLLLAARFADRVAILGEGGLLALGVPEEVLTRAVLREALGIDAEVVREGAALVLRLR
jgi:ABC-type cobalamin/Fe3+-siderophores transport system ATPase subunit